MEQVKKCILKRKEGDECSIGIAREGGHDEADERVKKVVVRDRDDGKENEGEVEKKERVGAL